MACRTLPLGVAFPQHGFRLLKVAEVGLRAVDLTRLGMGHLFPGRALGGDGFAVGEQQRNRMKLGEVKLLIHLQVERRDLGR